MKPQQASSTLLFTPLDPVERHTIPEIFFHGIDTFTGIDAHLEKADGSWQGISHAEILHRVAAVALHLDMLGLSQGDRVAIVAENRSEWAVSDFAIAALGLVGVPLYPSLPADQSAFILADAGVRVAFASTKEQWSKLQSVREKIPSLETIIGFDADTETDGIVPYSSIVQQWPDLPGQTSAEWLRKQARAVKPEDLATLIYTSGTTGAPKGVMLTHHNLASMVVATKQHGSFPCQPGDVALSFLPLSHIFERAADYFYWDSGITVAYAESVSKVPANLKEVRPHTMVSVPRVFEVIFNTMQNATGVKKKIIDQAVRVGGAVADAHIQGQSPPMWASVQFPVMDKLVYSQLRNAVGGRVKALISGGAPLAAEIARFFSAAGLPIHEGYGLTETSPVLSANRPGAIRFGSVGLPYPGVRLRVGDQGELLAQTPGLMKGYWNLPESTAEAIDEEGWFRTGDVVEVDEEGFIFITDRLKDLIVTTGGKNIAPQPIEARVQESPYIARAVMTGDRRPYPVLLLEAQTDKLRTWAKAEGIKLEFGEDLLQNDKVVQFLRREALQPLRDIAAHERPKKVAVLPEPLTLEAGFLTPTLKVRRRAVERHYESMINSLYE